MEKKSLRISMLAAGLLVRAPGLVESFENERGRRSKKMFKYLDESNHPKEPTQADIDRLAQAQSKRVRKALKNVVVEQAGMLTGKIKAY